MAVGLTFKGSDAGARATAEAVAKSLDQLGISADSIKFKFDDSGKGSDALFGKMKELRGEARQHDRVFAYYGAQLASVTGIAKGLGTEISGLGIALGSGMWAVAGVEAVKLLIGAWREWGAASKEEMSRMLADALLLADTEKALWKSVQQAMNPVTEAQKAYNETLKTGDEAANKLHEQFMKMQAAGPGMLAWIKAAFGDDSGLRDFNYRVAEAQKRIDEILKKGREAGQAAKEATQDKEHYAEANRLRMEAAKLEGEIAAAAEHHRQTLDTIARDVNLTAEEKKKASALENTAYDRSIQKLEAMRAAKMEQLAYDERLLGVSTEVARLEVQQQHAIDQIAFKMHGASAEELKALQQELAATDAIYAERIRIAQIKEQFASPVTGGTEDEGQGKNLSKTAGDVVAENDHRKFLERRAAEKKSLLESEAEARRFGMALGAALTGARTPADALIGTMKAVTDAVTDSAIKSLEAYIVSSEGAAYFSQVGIPVIGPVLAVAAAATAGSIVSGYLNQLTAREAGGPISAGVPYLVGERGPEVIVPSGGGTVIPNYAIGGGGGDVHVHVHGAVDPVGLERVLRDNKSGVQKVLREMTRAGRSV